MSSIADTILADATLTAHAEAGEWASIVTALKEEKRHKQNTNTDAVFRLLVNQYRAMRRTIEGGWTGPMVSAVQNSNNAVLIAGFEQLMTQPWDVTAPIRTHDDAEVGYLTTALTQIAQAVVQPPYDAAHVQTEMDKLTGGPLWRDVTAEQVQTAWADYQSEQVLIRKIGAVNDSLDLVARAIHDNRETTLQQAIDQFTTELTARW